MTIMKWISHLKSIYCVSPSRVSYFFNLSWSQSILVHAVIVYWRLSEPHGSSREEIVTLFIDPLNLWMLNRLGSKCLGADFLLTIVKKLWLLDDCKDIIRPFECNFVMALQLRLLLRGEVLGDWHR